MINLINLRLVDTSLCNVSGDISVFSNMNLTKFNSWRCPNIYGDIGECFKSSSSLCETRLYNTQISGSINSLASCTRLVALDVNKLRSAITGTSGQTWNKLFYSGQTYLVIV